MAIIPANCQPKLPRLMNQGNNWKNGQRAWGEGVGNGGRNG